MRNRREQLSSHLRIPIGVLLLVLAGWIIFHARNQWSHVLRAQPTQTSKRPDEDFIPPDLAKDPAMQATKAKVVGPMATMLEHSSAATAEDPIPNALPADSPESTPHEPLSLADRASTTEHPPLPLCSGKIIVSDSHAFPFQVPPHANFPRVTGTFTSSAGGAPEAIEILIFDQQQYDDYTHGGAGTATFQDEASGGHVDFALSSTLSEPRQYYLVFHNPSRRPSTVAAKFTVNFD